jgi:hypothetical protein
MVLHHLAKVLTVALAKPARFLANSNPLHLVHMVTRIVEEDNHHHPNLLILDHQHLLVTLILHQDLQDNLDP